MNTDKTSKCLDPDGLGLLREECMSGALNPEVHPERARDFQRFQAHMLNCDFCLNTMQEQVFAEEGMPILNQFARERGVSVEELQEQLAKHVEKHGIPRPR